MLSNRICPVLILLTFVAPCFMEGALASLRDNSYVATEGPFPDMPVPATNVWVAQNNPSEDFLWTEANTWIAPAGSAATPGPGDVVHIPFGVQVEIRSSTPGNLACIDIFSSGWPGLRYVRIDGSLRFGALWNTELATDTLYIGECGELLIGETATPVQSNLHCHITIVPEVDRWSVVPKAKPIDSAWDSKEISRGIIVDGTLKAFGQRREHVAMISEDIIPVFGSPTTLLTNLDPLWNWKSGDTAVLAGTYFKRGDTEDQPLTDECFLIDISSGNVVAPAGSLAKRHMIPEHPDAAKEFKLHLIHLSRNVEFRSGWADICDSPMASVDNCKPYENNIPIRARGHFMARTPSGVSKDVVLEYVRFDQFGRTNKKIPLDDVQFSGNPHTHGGIYPITRAPGFQEGTFAPLNRRGRYAVHFHKNGFDTPGVPKKTLLGCVVSDTPGWGFVNHSSNVAFEDCVAYDFAGSGFITESGDEIGSFTDCIAMHGTGPDHEKGSNYFFSRLVFGDWRNPTRAPYGGARYRPQVIGDFGFGGDGFWFQGPMVSVERCVANTCSGAGVLWFGAGAVNDYLPLAQGNKERYAGVPFSILQAVYGTARHANVTGMRNASVSQGQVGPRHWLWDPQMAVIADLPILKMENVTTYANLVGVHLRFCWEDANDFYTEEPFNYDLETSQPKFLPTNRPEQVIDGLEAWNNEQAFRARYCEKTRWRNVVAVNRTASFSPYYPMIGAELEQAVRDHILDNVYISGYPLALLLQSTSNTSVDLNDNTSEISGLATLKCEDYVIKHGMRDRASLHGGIHRMIDRDSISSTPTGHWPKSGFCVLSHKTQVITGSVVAGQVPKEIQWASPALPDMGQIGNRCIYNPRVSFPKRFLIRYRPVTGPDRPELFEYFVHDVVGPPVSLNSAIVPGLRSGNTYEVQVIANFDNTRHPPYVQLTPGPLAPWSKPVDLFIQ